MLQLVTYHGNADVGSGNTEDDPSKKHVDGWKRNGEVGLSGSMTRQVCIHDDAIFRRTQSLRDPAPTIYTCTQTEQDHPLQDANSHITNTGRMIEEMEIKMRNLLQEVYFGKTRDVVYDLRSLEDLEKARRQRELQKELVGFIKR
jgi:capping protein (actin filament) muscle Z-line, beta